MRLKIALLFAALVGFGNVRAGVVGISPATTDAAAGSQGFTFKTTGLTGSKITGIGLYGFSTQAASGSALTINLTNGTTADDKAGTFNVAATAIGAENTITWTGGSFSLTAEKTYTVSIAYASSGLTNANFRQMGTGTYTVASGVSDYWTEPVKGANDAMGVYLYYDPASVPEPATMILTGSALAAGAIGVYFKRRRKPQTEIAA